MAKIYIRHISQMLFVATMLLVSLCTNAQPPQTRVTVEATTKVPFTETQKFVGQVISNESGVIASEVKGRVQRVLVEVGDRIKTGDVLAILDTARLEIEVNLAKARVDEQEAILEAQQLLLKQAELDLKRQTRLVDTPAFSKADLEDREIDLANSKADLLARQAELERYIAEYDLANLNFERAKIRTLYSGIVTEKRVQAGSFINEGSDIAVVVNEKDLEIEVNVPRRFVRPLKGRAEIEIILDGDQRAVTRLRSIVMAENILSRTISIRLIPTPEVIEQLIPNQSIQVLIPLAKNKEVITVNKDALINRQGQFYVYTVKDNKAQLKAVTLGNPIGSRFEVVNGLEEGDLVVIRGNERLQPEQAVQYKIRNQGTTP